MRLILITRQAITRRLKLEWGKKMDSDKIVIIGLFTLIFTLIISLVISEINQNATAENLIEKGYAANEVYCAIERTDSACGFAALATASK